MRKNFYGVALCAVLFALCTSVEAQQQAKIYKVGELAFRSASMPATGRELLRRELRELGYVDGKNIIFETRFAEGKLDRLPAAAEELARLKVDVIIATSTPEILAAKSASRTIPIVFIYPGDPVAAGLVESLARPGGNMTGFSTIGFVLAGKRLELLKETVPKLSRVAVLWDPKMRAAEQTWKENQPAARELGLQLHSMEVSSADQYDSAFKQAITAGSTALSVTQSPVISSDRKRIVDLAAKYRLPAIYPRKDFVESGGLMSYGADQTEPYTRVASMLDKILKGTSPTDLPVEQPKKFELVINLKAAKQIGLTIPPNVLARADRVIR
jgi:putative tryptophan/tyrosine transport system substrate-binding protein